MFFSCGSKFLLGSVCLIVGLSGCESVRETLGMNQSAPDEFSESPFGKDLALPPSFDKLPEPKSDGAAQNPFGPAVDLSKSSTALGQAKTSGQEALLRKIPQANPPQRSTPIS